MGRPHTRAAIDSHLDKLKNWHDEVEQTLFALRRGSKDPETQTDAAYMVTAVSEIEQALPAAEDLVRKLKDETLALFDRLREPVDKKIELRIKSL